MFHNQGRVSISTESEAVMAMNGCGANGIGVSKSVLLAALRGLMERLPPAEWRHLEVVLADLERRGMVSRRKRRILRLYITQGR